MNEEQILEQWTTQGFVTKTSLRLNVCQAFISFFLPSSSEHPSTPLFAGALGHRRARRLLSARRQGCFSSEFPTPPGGQRGLAPKKQQKKRPKRHQKSETPERWCRIIVPITLKFNWNLPRTLTTYRQAPRTLSPKSKQVVQHVCEALTASLCWSVTCKL